MVCGFPGLTAHYPSQSAPSTLLPLSSSLLLPSRPMPLLPATCLSLFPSDPCTYHLPASAALPTAAGSLAGQSNSRSSQPEPAWIPRDEWGWQNHPSSDGPLCVVSFGCLLLLAGCWPVSSPPEHGAVSPSMVSPGVLGIVSCRFPNASGGKKNFFHRSYTWPSFSAPIQRLILRQGYVMILRAHCIHLHLKFFVIENLKHL